MDWDMCNMAAKTKSCCHCLFCRLCNIFVLRAMSSFHHLSFQSQLGSLLFSLLLQVITLCLWQACAPAVERPRCAFGSCPSCPFAFGCHVPLPLASPCARRGTPEVRLWLVSIMSLCLWQARAPAVERPRCALGSCPSCPFAFGKPVRPLWNARGAPLAVCVCLVSMSCPFAFGKPVRPPWNARGAPLAVCLCPLPSCHAFASPSWHICCDMKVLVSCCIIRAVSKKQRSKEGSFVCKHAAWPHSAPISLFAFLEPHSAQNCLKIEYTLLQFTCVFPVAYSCVQFPAVAFQLQIPVANSIYIGGSIRRRKN